VSDPFITTDPDLFQQQLASVSVQGGGDCPEMVIAILNLKDPTNFFRSRLCLALRKHLKFHYQDLIFTYLLMLVPKIFILKVPYSTLYKRNKAQWVLLEF